VQHQLGLKPLHDLWSRHLREMGVTDAKGLPRPTDFCAFCAVFGMRKCEASENDADLFDVFDRSQVRCESVGRGAGGGGGRGRGGTRSRFHHTQATPIPVAHHTPTAGSGIVCLVWAPTAHCPLPTAHCPLPTAHSHCPLPLPTVHCPLPTAHCPLPTAHCPLPTFSSAPAAWTAPTAPPGRPH
jgi:hypothetical protein